MVRSSSSQLPTPWLTPAKHTIFGEVADQPSTDVVDKIDARSETSAGDRPKEDVVINSITIRAHGLLTLVGPGCSHRHPLRMNHQLQRARFIPDRLTRLKVVRDVDARCAAMHGRRSRRLPVP